MKIVLSPQKMLQVDGTRLHYTDEGEGPAVVLIHGMYGSLFDYKLSIFDELKRHLRVVAIDMPGHGFSERPRPRMTLGDHAKYLHEALKSLGVKKPVLVGHSWGGALVLRYTLEYPSEVAGLVSLSAYVKPYHVAAPLYHLSSAPVAGELFSRFIVQPLGRLLPPSFFLGEPFFPDKVPAIYADNLLPIALRTSDFRASAQEAKSLGRDLIWMGERYGNIRVPVTIVTGDSDLVTPPKQNAHVLQRAIPHARLVTLERTGHQPAFTKPAEVLEAIRTLVGSAERLSVLL